MEGNTAADLEAQSKQPVKVDVVMRRHPPRHENESGCGEQRQRDMTRGITQSITPGTTGSWLG